MTAPADRPADQAYYWADDWQASEAEAEADLRAGRSRVFPDMGAAVAYLTEDDDAALATGGPRAAAAPPEEES